jgi:hypothetical protein
VNDVDDLRSKLNKGHLPRDKSGGASLFNISHMHLVNSSSTISTILQSHHHVERVRRRFTLESALQKEKVIKDILQLRDGLRGLMARVGEVEGENDKLAKDNEMLSTYIDNL